MPPKPELLEGGIIGLFSYLSACIEFIFGVVQIFLSD